jgi:hypothetical protein
MRSLKKHIDTETRMNAIFRAIFAHTHLDSLKALQNVYGELFGWDWIKTNLLSYFPKKVKPGDAFPTSAATTLKHRARDIKLLQTQQSLTTKARSEDRFQRSEFALNIPVGRDAVAEARRKSGKRTRIWLLQSRPIFLFYNARMDLTKNWQGSVIAKNIPNFPEDFPATGFWNASLMFINYPWGWTKHDWDIKWTREMLTVALNNFKGPNMYVMDIFLVADVCR